MDLRLMTKLGGDLPSPPSSSSPSESSGKAVKMSNFCSIDKLLGKADENKSSGGGGGAGGFPANPFKGSHAARLGMRMPGVLEIVNGLQQHKAAAALRGELGREGCCLP